MNTKVRSSLALAFKAVALGIAALSIVFTALDSATPEFYAILLSIGVFSLAIAAISDRPVC